MVRRTLKVITSKISGLREAAFWLALFSLFSQVLAMMRDRLLAHNFGAGMELDIYYASFRIPDMIFVTVASLVSISALVPLFAKKETEGEKHLKDATDSVFTVFGLLIFVFCILAYFLMPFIIKTFFSDLSLYALDKTIFFSRFLLLSPLLLGFSNFFGSIVQYEKRFILYSLSPLLYNLGIILGIFFFSDSLGITSAVIGVVFGAVLHLFLQAVFVIISPMRPSFTFEIKWQDVKDVALLSIPRTFALSITSFVAFFFVVLASKMGEGSIAVFNFSWNLQSAPLSLIGASFSLASFPALAISFARKNIEDVIERISEGLRQIIFWSIPFSAILIFLRAHIVRVILGSGQFDWSATRLVAGFLAIFVFSAVFQSISLFLSRSHYALGKTKWPLFGNIIGGVVSVLSAILFINYPDLFKDKFVFLASVLDIYDLYFYPIILPVSYSIGSIIASLVLFFALGKDLFLRIWRNISKTFFDSVVASVFCSFGIYFGLKIFDSYFDLEKFIGVFSHGLISGLLGIIFAILTFYVLKSEELFSVLNGLSKNK